MKRRLSNKDKEITDLQALMAHRDDKLTVLRNDRSSLLYRNNILAGELPKTISSLDRIARKVDKKTKPHSATEGRMGQDVSASGCSEQQGKRTP